MKVTMTIGEAVSLRAALEPLLGVKNSKVGFATIRNQNYLNTQLKEFDELRNGRGPLAPDGMEAFQAARETLVKHHASKTPNGKPVIKNGQYDIADPEAFAKGFDDLRAEHREAIDACDNAVKELGESEQEFDLHWYEESWFPEDTPGVVLQSVLVLLRPEAPDA